MSEWHEFLTKQGAQWQGEKLTAFAGDEQKHLPQLVPMVEHSLLQASGTDAAKFLQGQCTCDVYELEKQRLLLGAHCNRQGRMISSFTLAGLAQGVGLRLRRDIAQTTLSNLQRYIVFAKASLEMTDYVGLAVIGANPQDLPLELPAQGQYAIADGVSMLHHQSGLVELWVEPQQAPALWQSLAAHCQPAAPAELDLHLIQQGIAEVQAATQEAHIPQHFNYHALGAINFKKGCYTGQEIIARMQYRGQLKKHCYRLVDQTSTTDISVGTELYAANEPDKKVAQVVASAKGQVLALCNEDVAQAKLPLSAADSETNFQWAELPYAIP